MKRAYLIHGWDGYPEEGWRPWLKEKLEEKGWKVVSPAMPNTATPKLNEWLSHLKQVIGTPDEECYLVGHSLGCITILRYLEQLNEHEKVGGAILVAGFSYDLEYEGYNAELSTFFQTPVHFAEIKKHCNQFVVLHSEDDQWVSPKQADVLEEKLDAKKIIQRGMKHYSGDDGVHELPIVFDELMRLAK